MASPMTEIEFHTFAGDGKLSRAGAPRKEGAMHRDLDKLDKWDYENLAV